MSHVNENQWKTTGDRQAAALERIADSLDVLANLAATESPVPRRPAKVDPVQIAHDVVAKLERELARLPRDV